MNFKVVEDFNDANEEGIIFLKYLHYDDYGYCTSFAMYYMKDQLIHLGYVKIGHLYMSTYGRQGTSQNGFKNYSIINLMPTDVFEQLGSEFYSLGEEISYYKNIINEFNDSSDAIFRGLKDLAYDFDRFFELYNNNEVPLINSLMRSLHYPNIEQFNRIICGESELTDYNFSFMLSSQKIDVTVVPDSLPPSNIHVLIGRNGVGKTWLLYQMVFSILSNMDLNMTTISSQKYDFSPEFISSLDPTTFSGIIGVSFSIFDDGFSSFQLSYNTQDELNTQSYQDRKSKDDYIKTFKYIGIVDKTQKDGRSKIKSVDNLADEFISVIEKIKKSKDKTGTFFEMCNQLSIDSMFNDNGFITLLRRYFEDKEKTDMLRKQFKRLSSGHMIIMLSLSLLCESVLEKTIVLIDEPETHLHPPLLSTYIRTLSFLLRKKNAVAIIATHSPIVVQEVPSSCVTIVDRIQEEMSFSRPKIESFASNTDSLTREIFGYEVIKTGFYKLLEDEVEDTFEETFKKFDNKIGTLGQILVQRLSIEKGNK